MTAQGLRLRDLGSANATQVAGCFAESADLSLLVPIEVGRQHAEGRFRHLRDLLRRYRLDP
jgi:hypothetical protein